MRMHLPTKQLLSFVLLLTTLLFFNACQKTDSLNIEAQEVSVTEKVESWLDEQIAMRTPENAAIVRQVKDNLLLTQTFFEKLNDKEQLVIIPISENFVSKNNKGKPVTNYLLLVLSEENKFKSGNIVQYLPENKTEKADFPKNNFHKIYNNNTIIGQFTFLSISDRYIYEKEFKDNRLFRCTTKTSKKNSGVSTDTNCIDWYLVSTWTYPDGTTYTTEIYVGRTCNGCGGTDECLDPGDGGGSGAIDQVVSEESYSGEIEVDPDGDVAAAPVITYTYHATKEIVNGGIINVIIHPITASPMISNYINRFGVPTTRTLTLFGQGGSWTPTNPLHGLVSWWCLVYGHYVYTNGDASRSYQWSKSSSKAY